MQDRDGGESRVGERGPDRREQRDREHAAVQRDRAGYVQYRGDLDGVGRERERDNFEYGLVHGADDGADSGAGRDHRDVAEGFNENGDGDGDDHQDVAALERDGLGGAGNGEHRELQHTAFY